MNMKNIRNYIPDVKPYGDVQYFCDEQGRDWYENNKNFKKKYVVQYNSYGVIKAVVKAEQASLLHPGGTSVAEVNTLPADFSLSTAIWIFDGKKITKTSTDPSVPTKYRKEQANASLTKEIAPLQDAISFGEATEEEKDRHERLCRLRVRVMRIADTTPPEEVDWSEFKGL